MENLISYYINFITLLPVNILSKYKEGVSTKNYFNDVLNNAFTKEVQKNFLKNKILKKYEGKEEIKIEEFFNDHYYTLKDDNQLRKDFVSNYINSLSSSEVRKLIID